MFFLERPSHCVLSNLYDILCTVNTEHTSRQDAIITIRLYLATRFGRKRPSSGQLRTTLRYSKNSTQWNTISSTFYQVFNVNEMGSHWVLFLLYLNIVLNWPEDGHLRPKHVAKYNLIVTITSCLDVCCVLTVHNILHKIVICVLSVFYIYLPQTVMQLVRFDNEVPTLSRGRNSYLL